MVKRYECILMYRLWSIVETDWQEHESNMSEKLVTTLEKR